MNKTIKRTAEPDAERMLQLEAFVLDGQAIPMGTLEELPLQALQRSPLLTREYACRLWSQGRLQEARHLLGQAVKRSAGISDSRHMVHLMALLAQLHLQIGDAAEAVTLLRFLRDEFERAEDHRDGCGQLRLALAKGRHLIDPALDLDPAFFFRTALEAFADEGEILHIACAILDWWTYEPKSIHEEDWQRWLLYLKQQTSVHEDAALSYQLMQAVHEIKQGNCARAQTAAEKIRWPEIPFRYAGLTRTALLKLISAEGGRVDFPDMLSASPDIDVKIHALHLNVITCMEEDNPAGAEQALAEARPIGRLTSDPSHARLILDMERRISTATAARTFAADHQDPDRSWRVFCMGGLRFESRLAEVKELHWKRKKAKELFVYLCFQSEYKAVKEQLMEILFQDVEPDKADNRLYVTVHQLKKILKESLGFEQGVTLRDGIVSLQSQKIELVDAEKYMALARVGDQLWAADRETAAELYEKAAGLYGELLPEMPYIDWLERTRNMFREKQSMILNRLGSHFKTVGDENKAEMFYLQLIEMDPSREETYHGILELLMGQKRKSEAIRLYRRVEDVCRKEFGTDPMKETKQLVWG